MPNKKVPLGKPLTPIPASYVIQQPTPQDWERTRVLWDENCPPFYRGLMASAQKGDGNMTSKFIFDKKTGRYTHRRSGRVLKRQEIQEAYAKFVEKLTGK